MEEKESNTESQRSSRDMGMEGDCFLTKNISVHVGVWCPFSSDSICVSEYVLMDWHIIQRFQEEKEADMN